MEMVRAWLVLYDKSHRDHFDKIIKANNWLDISAAKKKEFTKIKNEPICMCKPSSYL